MKHALYAPPGYVNAPPEIKRALNGCGTAGWKNYLVPDTILGLCVTPACNIHDWMYTVGDTLNDKQEADRVFLNNMVRLIENAGGWWILKRMRLNRAFLYYQAVKNFGGAAFWDGKNSESNLVLQEAA